MKPLNAETLLSGRVNELPGARPPTIRVSDEVPYVEFVEAITAIGLKVETDGRGGLIVVQDR